MGLGFEGESWVGGRYLGVISVLIVIEIMGVEEIIYRWV